MDGRLVLQEDLHPDERLPALLSEHVPGLRSRQQVRHRALGEAQHGLAEQSLADAVLAEDLLDPPDDVVRVEVAVPTQCNYSLATETPLATLPVELLLSDWR